MQNWMLKQVRLLFGTPFMNSRSLIKDNNFQAGNQHWMQLYVHHHDKECMRISLVTSLKGHDHIFQLWYFANRHVMSLRHACIKLLERLFE